MGIRVRLDARREPRSFCRRTGGSAGQKRRKRGYVSPTRLIIDYGFARRRRIRLQYLHGLIDATAMLASERLSSSRLRAAAKTCLRARRPLRSSRPSLPYVG
jgi:hypothetical protein